MKAAVVLEEVQMLLFHFSAEFVCGVWWQVKCAADYC